MVVLTDHMNFFARKFPQNIEQFPRIESHFSRRNDIGRIIPLSTNFQVGCLNADAVFFGGNEQVGEDGHRTLGLHDSLNLLNSVKESVFIDPDFHEVSLQLGGLLTSLGLA